MQPRLCSTCLGVLHILADYLAFPSAPFILYLALGALTAECCGVDLIVPALALLDFAADCDLPWLFKTAPALAFPVSVIDLIGAPTVLRLLNHCGLICWPLFFQEPRMLLLSFIRQLLSCMWWQLLAAVAPKAHIFWRHADYTYFVYTSSALSPSHQFYDRMMWCGADSAHHSSH